MRNGETVRYYKLITRCRMEPAAVCAMEMCLTVLQYQELTEVLQKLGYPGVTLELAMLAEAVKLGYDTSKLIWVDQSAHLYQQ